MPKKPSLRPVKDSDADFLLKVYTSTRSDISDHVQLTEIQKSDLLQNQFQAQQVDYARNFPDANHDIIKLANDQVGQLYINRTPDEIHVVDISILPKYRSSGLGSVIMKQLKSEAIKTSRAIRIHVINGSRALRFYKRHGFVEMGEKQFHIEMRWTPENVESDSAKC